MTRSKESIRRDLQKDRELDGLKWESIKRNWEKDRELHGLE